MYRGPEMPHVKQQRWHFQCSAYTLVSGHSAQCCTKGKKKMNKIQINTEEKARQCAQWWNPKAHFHSVKLGREDKPTAISKIRDGHLTLLLIFTSSDGWNAIRGEKKKKESKKEKSRHREVVIGNCSWQLFVQAPDFFHLYANPASPHWKTGQVPLMSNLFQSSRVWAWQFTERLEELVITSVTGQLMHITLRHSWRWLSAPQ